MPACPRCSAIYDSNRRDLERCETCGSYLPRAGTVQAASMEMGVPPASSEGDAQPAATIPAPSAPATSASATSNRSAEHFIQPRNLSANYAQHVTEYWTGTNPASKNPHETINSNTGTTEQEEDLLIGMRSVVRVEDGRRGDYELDDVIGKGGMGEVWSARQSSLNRKVAIKFPKTGTGGTQRERSKFIFEVVVTGQLDHPNIVPIYDFARDTDGRLFYSMKRLDGQPWNKCIHDGSLSQQQNIEILMKVADALRFAHDHDVIHCDIKPQNIVVGKYGEVSVMDFGAAIRLDGDTGSGSSASTSLGGTPSYMPPEIASVSRGQVCRATDVYLLGAVLYEILAGRPPHPEPPENESIRKMVEDAILIAANNEITPLDTGGELRDIAYKALATDIAKRYQKVDDFQKAIRNYLSHAESIALAERGQQHLRRATDDHGGPASPGARFDEFDQARFAFDEAVKLWPENKPAIKGFKETIIAYANYTYHEGAYARGISLLDPTNDEHEPLLKKLTAARKNTNRLWLLLRTAIVIMICGGTVLSCSLYIENRRARRAEADAKKNEKFARAAETSAENNLKTAKEQEERANSQATRARKAEKQANENLDLAKQQEQNAINEAKRASRAEKAALLSSYASEIGDAEKALQRNVFGRVKKIIADQAIDGTKKELRAWEWGYLNFLANLQPVESFATHISAQDDASQRFETAAISPDGKCVVAGSVDGFALVWPQKSTQNPILLQDKDGGFRFKTINSVAVGFENGKYLIAVAGVADTTNDANRSTQPNVVRIWQLSTDGKQELLPDTFSHDKPVLSVAFSKNASQLLTSGADGKAILWNRSTNQPALTLAADLLGRNVWSAQFSPDETLIVTASDNDSVRVWNRAGERLDRYSDHGGPAYAAVFLPDGKHVISGGRDGRVIARALRHDNPEKQLAAQKDDIENALKDDAGGIHPREFAIIGSHAGPVKSISVSPDRKHVYSAGNDNTVGVWNVEQGIEHAKCEKVLRGHGGWVRACAAVGDNQVLSAGYDNRVQLWTWPNYHSPRVLANESAERPTQLRLTTAAIAPHDHWIATGSESGMITVWDMSNWENPKPQELYQGHEFQATTGILFKQGTRLVTAAGDNTTLVWDTETGRELQRIGSWFGDGTGWRGIAAVAPSGGLIATGSSFPDHDPFHSKQLPADQNYIPIPLARVWNAADGKQLAVMTLDVPASTSETEATALAFSADDRILLVGDQFGECRLYDARTGALQRSFAAHRGKKVVAAKFLSDNRRLLTAGADRMVKLWDLSTNVPRLVTLFPQGDQVMAMDVSADEKNFITAAGPNSPDAAVRIWEIDTGKLVASLSLDEILKSLELKSDDGTGASSANRHKGIRPSIRSVTFHPNKSAALITAYSPHEDNTLARSSVGEWRWEGGQNQLHVVSKQPDVSMAVYSPQQTGNKVLTVGGRGALLLAQNKSQTDTSFRPQPGTVSLSFSSDERTLASVANDGSVKFWELGENRRWKSGPNAPGLSKSRVLTIEFSPGRPANGENNEFITAGTDGVSLWQPKDGTWMRAREFRAPNFGSMRKAVFSPDGKYVLAISGESQRNPSLLVWERETGTLVREPDELPTNAQCLAMSPDGRWIAVGCQETVTILSMNDLSKSMSAKGHAANITEVCFSSDGKRLFSSSEDFTIKVWDASPLDRPSIAEQQGEKSDKARELTAPVERLEKDEISELLTLTEHQGFVTSVQLLPINPDRQFLLTTSLDGQAILWPSDMEVKIESKPNQSVEVR